MRKTIDCLVATCCLRHQHALLHGGRDFMPFARHLGLRLVSASRSGDATH